jgi:hypothetical protein
MSDTTLHPQPIKASLSAHLLSSLANQSYSFSYNIFSQSSLHNPSVAKQSFTHSQHIISLSEPPASTSLPGPNEASLSATIPQSRPIHPPPQPPISHPEPIKASLSSTSHPGFSQPPHPVLSQSKLLSASTSHPEPNKASLSLHIPS